MLRASLQLQKTVFQAPCGVQFLQLRQAFGAGPQDLGSRFESLPHPGKYLSRFKNRGANALCSAAPPPDLFCCGVCFAIQKLCFLTDPNSGSPRFGVSGETFHNSMREYRNARFDGGASGAVMFFSENKRFIVKQMEVGRCFEVEVL